MVKRKIGISTAAYLDKETQCVDYAQIKAHGYNCVDVQHFTNPQNPVYSMDEVALQAYIKEEKDRIRQAGLEPSQMHAVWPTDDTTEEKREQKDVWLIRDIAICHWLGCRYLVLHPTMPYGWDREDDPAVVYRMNVALLQRLLPHAVAYDVTLCLENMPFKALSLATVKKTVAVVDEVHHENVGVCLDTGHAIIQNEACGEMVRFIGKRLKVLHIHDNNGVDDGHMPPLTGVIDWEDFKAALREIPADVCLSLECSAGKGLPPEEQQQKRIELVRSARYLADR